MLKLEKRADRHGRTGWYLRDDSGVWVAQIYQTGDPAEDGDVLPTPREAYDWAQRIIAALTTPAPQPSADDAALVDAFEQAISDMHLRQGFAHDADEARAALLAALAKTAPEGWRLVPVVPTEEMLAATCDENGRPRILDFTKPEDRSKPYLMARYIYPAMLAAAPKVTP